jgi:hypothetical protein
VKKKIFIVILLCGFLFVAALNASASGNTKGPDINGNDWQKMSVLEKAGFVLGWVKCGQKAVDSILVPLDGTTDEFNKSIQQTNFQVETYKDKGILFGGVTIRQIVDTIDAIYSDPRTTTMDIADIMPLVSGRLIKGWTLKELDEVISIKMRLIRCEKEEKLKSSIGECSSLRGALRSYLEKLKKK